MNATGWRKKLNKLLADRDHAARKVVEEKAALAVARKQHKAARHAQELIQKAAEGVQNEAQKQFSAVVTKCIKAIYGDAGYEFKFLVERKRGRTEAKPVLCRGDLILEDPINEAGHGPVQVAALGMRVAAVLLGRPPLRRLLTMDEPFLALDKQKSKRVRNLLEMLVNDLGFQIIMATHSPDLVCGKVVEL